MFKKLKLPELRFGKSAVLLLVFLLAGYLLGFSQGYTVKRLASPSLTDQAGLASQDEFGLFWTVSDLIDKRYDSRFDLKSLVYGATAGLVEGLGDPYSVFSLPRESRRFFQELAGAYEGAGIEIEVRREGLVVVTPLQGSPAARAGIKPGDLILFIDRQSTEGFSVDEAIAKIRGPRGSEVLLTIQRDGKVAEFSIRRELVQLKSVQEREEEGLAVVSISKFVDDTPKLFQEVVRRIEQREPRGVILDLRNNPGGLLDAAVEVANEFLPGGLSIVEERFKDGQLTTFTSDGLGRLQNMPLVVLINAGTASAAEIVAGALQDHKRAQLVGERSFGKGNVQEVTEFTDGSTLRLTVARWYTPRGRFLGQGLKPNIVVSESEEEDTVLSRAKKLFP